MKIGVSSYSYSAYMRGTKANYFAVCDHARKTGFGGIEFIDLSLDVQKADSVLELARDIRAYCAGIGLDIIAYTVNADFLREGGPEKEAERLKGCVDVAKALGAPVMRHDATWQRTGDWRDVVRAIAPSIRELTRYAAAQGIRTCTENHGFFIQDSNRVEALIQEVGHPNYGWLVDMGNFACADEDSVHAVTIAAPYAFHVHAKDFLIKPACAPAPAGGWFDSRHGTHLRGTVVGHGCIPVKRCLDILKEAGYQGWVSLEFEGMEDNIPAIEAGFANLRQYAGE